MNDEKEAVMKEQAETVSPPLPSMVDGAGLALADFVMGEAVLPGEEAPEETEQAPKKRRHWYKHVDVNDGARSFADGLNVYKVIWVFTIGCVIGVVFETLFVYFQEGVWMRRSGMLYGPFNQIYGLGAVLFTLVLYRFRKKNALFIFLFSALIGAAFEYLCSWVQQLVFGSVSWEYSDMPANIGGRTNVFYALGWGLMGLIFITHAWPYLSEMIERIPNKIGKTLSICVAVFLAVDLALSGMAVFRESQRAAGVPATNVIASWLDATYPDDVMAEKYPSMEFVGRTGDPADATNETTSTGEGATEEETTDQQGDGQTAA